MDTFDQFQKAAEIVEKIIESVDIKDLDTEIRKSSEDIVVEKRREFYRHMNALFLNVLLNRLDSTPKGTEEKVIRSRNIIVNILNIEK